MSATNRGAVRREADFYATPLESVFSFLDNFGEINPKDQILEPSAGNGAIINALRLRGYRNPVTAVELREEKELYFFADEVIYGDFLKMNFSRRYDVIISNPPYSLAQEFITKSLYGQIFSRAKSGLSGGKIRSRRDCMSYINGRHLPDTGRTRPLTHGLYGIIPERETNDKSNMRRARV